MQRITKLPARAPRRVPFTVLIVDDITTDRFVLRQYLLQDGYRVLLAESGQQAIELAQNDRLDLVLMDIGMPGMDGLSATQHIRRLSDGRTVPVVFQTAFDDAEMRARCTVCGADGVITKPYSQREIRELVAGILGVPRPLA